jgi:hypothetical protein
MIDTDPAASGHRPRLDTGGQVYLPATARQDLRPARARGYRGEVGRGSVPGAVCRRIIGEWFSRLPRCLPSRLWVRRVVKPASPRATLSSHYVVKNEAGRARVSSCRGSCSPSDPRGLTAMAVNVQVPPFPRCSVRLRPRDVRRHDVFGGPDTGVTWSRREMRQGFRHLAGRVFLALRPSGYAISAKQAGFAHNCLFGYSRHRGLDKNSSGTRESRPLGLVTTYAQVTIGSLPGALHGETVGPCTRRLPCAPLGSARSLLRSL